MRQWGHGLRERGGAERRRSTRVATPGRRRRPTARPGRGAHPVRAVPGSRRAPPLRECAQEGQRAPQDPRLGRGRLGFRRRGPRPRPVVRRRDPHEGTPGGPRLGRLPRRLLGARRLPGAAPDPPAVHSPLRPRLFHRADPHGRRHPRRPRQPRLRRRARGRPRGHAGGGLDPRRRRDPAFLLEDREILSAAPLLPERPRLRPLPLRQAAVLRLSAGSGRPPLAAPPRALLAHARRVAPSPAASASTSSRREPTTAPSACRASPGRSPTGSTRTPTPNATTSSTR